ncbi:hypothetical protein GCM10027442_55240 [Emticicia fontis]
MTLNKPAPSVILKKRVDNVSVLVCDLGNIVTLCEKTSDKVIMEKRIDRVKCFNFIDVFMGEK